MTFCVCALHKIYFNSSPLIDSAVTPAQRRSGKDIFAIVGEATQSQRVVAGAAPSGPAQPSISSLVSKINSKDTYNPKKGNTTKGAVRKQANLARSSPLPNAVVCFLTVS